MIYFILWVVFLLTVLLAVPVAAFLEKRQYRAANPSEAIDPIADRAGTDGEDWSDEQPADHDSPAEVDPLSGGGAANEVEEAVEFGEVDGGDEFAAFDDI